MRNQRIRTALAAGLTALTVTLGTAGFGPAGPPAVSAAGVALLNNSLLMMGGNDNPAAVTPVMQQELGGDPYYPGPNPRPFRPVGVFGQGYVDTANNPASPYYGWDYIPVEWPAQIGLPILGQYSYGESQRQGVQSLTETLESVLPTLGPDEQALAFGYSSSANVVVRTMRELQNEAMGPPSTDQLQFFLMGNPNRPNGGLLQRFRGLYIPFVDVKFDGTTPVDTPYQTIDVSWEYDGAADFPLYPLNLLAVLNSLIELHGNYFRADMNGPRALPDVTVGNITYVTLAAPHLPLLLPLYNMGFPQPWLDLVEPALTVMVDWGYDRSISPGTPTTARLIPRINPITAAVDLANAVVTGINNFIADVTPSRMGLSPSVSPAAGSAGSGAVTAASVRADRAGASRVSAAVRPSLARAQVTGKQTATKGMGGQIEIGGRGGGGGGAAGGAGASHGTDAAGADAGAAAAGPTAAGATTH